MIIHEFAQLWFDKWRSAVEILLLSVVIYYGYLYFRGTRGAKVLTGMAIVFLTLTLISQLLNLVVISFIIRSFSVFLAVALVVIFQPELRRALAELGGHPIFSLTPDSRGCPQQQHHQGQPVHPGRYPGRLARGDRLAVHGQHRTPDLHHHGSHRGSAAHADA